MNDIKEILIFDYCKSFAENKDIARELRLQHIFPEVKNKKEVILDFNRVDATTQSFVHALISDVIRKYGQDTIDLMLFKNCNSKVRAIIEIVIDYMQDISRKEIKIDY